MGTVLLAEDDLRQELVALKRIRNPSFEAMLRFKREFRSVADLTHPSLVRLFELGEDEDGLYFTMEVVQGVTLDHYCRYGGQVAATGPGPGAPTAPAIFRGASSSPATPSWTDSSVGAREGEGPGPHPSGISHDSGSVSPHAETVASGETGRAMTPPSGEEPTQKVATSDAIEAGTAWSQAHRGEVEVAEMAGGQPSGPWVLHRLFEVLPQLLDALEFLHGAGIVHRDLKPANVMVTPQGRVKLLDFGVLGRTEFANKPWASGDVMGTVGYMSPEQLRGQEPHPSMDLYSLGAMLFELVAGRSVFDGSHMAVMMAHLSEPPPKLSEMAPWAPKDFCDLVDKLLSKSPSERPGLDRIRAAIPNQSLSGRSSGGLVAVGASRLVGRDGLKETLSAKLLDDWDGDFVFVALDGPTGVGKSSLARWVARKADKAGRVVLRGRGRANERVPFNVVDGVIDELAPILNSIGDRQTMRHVDQLRLVASMAFPVLGRGGGTGAGVHGDASRQASFAALVDLFKIVAGIHGGVLIYLDDIHRADSDSLALLDHMVTVSPKGLALVATIRNDVEECAAARWLDGLTSALVLDVSALDDSAIQSILENVGGRAVRKLGREQLDFVRTLCRGNPMLAEVIGRRIAAGELEDRAGAFDFSLGGFIRSLMEGPDDQMVPLLAALVAADEWTVVRDIADLLGLRYGELADTLERAERSALVRSKGGIGPEGKVDIYHDSLREAILAALPPDAILDAHRRMADLLSLRPGVRPERVVRHLLASERTEEAAWWARKAARAAEDRRAFGLAADMYAVALSHWSIDPDGEPVAVGEENPEATQVEGESDRLSRDEWFELKRSRAICLQKSGRYGDALQTWKELVDAGRTVNVEDSLLVDGLLGQVQALLSSNEVVEGRKVLDEALEAAGTRPVGSSRFLDVLAGVAFMVGPHPFRDVLAREKGGALMDERAADRQVRIATLVGHFDVLTGIRMLLKARRRLLDAGYREQAASCDFLCGYFSLFAQPVSGKVSLAYRYKKAGMALLGPGEIKDPITSILPRFLDGVMAQHSGRLGEAGRILEEVQRNAEGKGLVGTYEYARAIYQRSILALTEQDIPKLEELLDHWEAVSKDSRSMATHANLSILWMYVNLFRGKLDEARQVVEQAVSQYPPDLENLQTRSLRFTTQTPAIYDTDCREARRKLDVSSGVLKHLGPMYQDVNAGTAALVEANALRSGDPEAHFATVRWLYLMTRQVVPMRPGTSLRAMAYALDAVGRPERALEALEEARFVALQYGQPIDLAIAEYQIGLRIKGSEGEALRDSALERVEKAGSSAVLLTEDAGLR